MEIHKKGSVRIDLLGGTLDLPPLNYCLQNSMTLNLATDLMAEVVISRIDRDGIEIISEDFNKEYFFAEEEWTEENLYNQYFQEMNLVAQILASFELTAGLRVQLKSGSPPGAGLGGSSSMAVTLYKALAEFKRKSITKDADRHLAIQAVRNMESRILGRGPCGYQDYYPAMFGGILGLIPKWDGVEVEQLYRPELAEFFTKHLTLVYSGKTRNSGINNWEVYKSFFDGDQQVRQGLATIANLSKEAYLIIKSGDWDRLPLLIAREGNARKTLFPQIMTEEMNRLAEDLNQRDSSIGIKVCGAGGGGCFLITHRENQSGLVEEMVHQAGMTKLAFQVIHPQ